MLFEFRFFIVALLILTVPTEAKAYVDPGSGSLLIQFFLATVIGGVYHFRRWIGRLRWWR